MREESGVRHPPSGMRRLRMLVAALAILAVSCGRSDGGAVPLTSLPPSSDPTAASVTSTSPPPTLVPSSTVGPVELIDAQPSPEDVEEAIRQATTDLAARTGAAPDQIEVVLSGVVTWNDGSLGCPEPGKMYTQSLVPGWRVVLSVAGSDYAYHGAQGGALFYCPSPSDRSSGDL